MSNMADNGGRNERSFCDILKEKDPEDYYELLGCDELNSKEQINVEFKKKALQYHPDKNTCEEQMFLRLQKARAVLCDDSQRKSYDCWRKSGLKEYISFDNWTKVNAQSQLHWGLPSKKKMLTESSGSVPSDKSSGEHTCMSTKSHRNGWSSGSSLKRKFQNYEI